MSASREGHPKPRPVCPECLAGKHGNCDGSAWDFERDELGTCACLCAVYPDLVGAGELGRGIIEQARKR